MDIHDVTAILRKQWWVIALVATAVLAVMAYSTMTAERIYKSTATVFVALVWLRVVFLAMVYGAAMARYRDYVLAARLLGEARPDAVATQHALDEEQRRARREMEASAEVERRVVLGTCVQRVDLVVQRRVGEVEADRSLPRRSSARRAPSVGDDHCKALVGEPLG